MQTELHGQAGRPGNDRGEERTGRWLINKGPTLSAAGRTSRARQPLADHLMPLAVGDPVAATFAVPAQRLPLVCYDAHVGHTGSAGSFRARASGTVATSRASRLMANRLIVPVLFVS